MKLPRFSGRRLDNRGISHIALPLAAIVILAVAGTFVTVAKRSGSVNLDAASTVASTSTGSSTKKPYGYLVLYTGKGSFNAVKVSSDGVSTDHNCTKGGKVVNGTAVKLPSKSQNGAFHPLTLRCAPTGGTGQYVVTYGNSNGSKFTDVGNVSVDIDGHDATTQKTVPFCTIVKPTSNTAFSVSKTATNDKKKCVTGDDATPVQFATSMRVLPTVSKSGKLVSGYVEVSAPGKNLNQTQCAGQVKLLYASAGGNSSALNLSLKYVSGKKSNINSYCAAKFRVTVPAPANATAYTFSATMDPTAYLAAPANQPAPATVTVPAVPAKKAKKATTSSHVKTDSNGGTPAN